MLAWLSQKLSAAWMVVAGAAVALIAAVAIVAKLMAAGRAQERAEARGKIIEDVEKRHEIDAAVARDPAPADSLRKRWSRD